jgi:hypothetical protein
MGRMVKKATRVEGIKIKKHRSVRLPKCSLRLWRMNLIKQIITMYLVEMNLPTEWNMQNS